MKKKKKKKKKKNFFIFLNRLFLKSIFWIFVTIQSNILSFIFRKFEKKSLQPMSIKIFLPLLVMKLIAFEILYLYLVYINKSF